MTKLTIQTGGHLDGLLQFAQQVRPRFWKYYALALDPCPVQDAYNNGSLVIARVVGGDQSFDGDPVGKAQAFANYVRSQIARVRPWIRIVEGINEPRADTEQEARDLSAWQVEFSKQMHADSLAVIAYDFANGNPPYTIWPLLKPGLDASEYLGLHEYWKPNMDEDAADLWQRHAKVFQIIGPKATIITECGQNTQGWQSTGKTPEQYASEVKRFDDEISKYDNIHGGTLFVMGSDSPQWTPFDIGNFDQRPLWISVFSGQTAAPPIPPLVTPPPPPPVTKTLLGIDVSAYQGDIDFDQLQTGFVLIKATEGVGFIDSKLARNQSEARRVGLPLGYYHFARPDLGNDPLREADWFMQVAAPDPGEVMVLDFEVDAPDSVGWSLAFLDRIRTLYNVKPLIYLNQTTLAGFDWSPVVAGGYGLWLAAYNDDPAQNNYPSGAWPFFAMRQWSTNTSVIGIGGQVDADVFFGDAQAFKRYGLTELPPTEDKMITSQEIAEAFPFLATLALRHDLGEHIYGEVRKQAADGKTYILDGWARAGIGVAEGDYVAGHEFYFDPRKDFAISSTPPTPMPVPTPAVRRVTTADLSYNWQVIPYQPKSGELFWGLVQVAGIQVGSQVGTQFTIFTRDSNGPKFGVPVTQAWGALGAETRHMSKTVLSDGDGVRHVVMGAGDDYTPGQSPPPDRIYVSSDDGVPEEVWPTPAGDVLICGQVGGHTQVDSIVFQLMTG